MSKILCDITTNNNNSVTDVGKDIGILKKYKIGEINRLDFIGLYNRLNNPKY
jgi:hypothetical protein